MDDTADLALYVYDGCGYCGRVHRALRRLGVKLEVRDIDIVRQHEADLLTARGERTVPVLRIKKADGHDEWMPESLDIIAYLERRFAAR